MTPIAMIKRFKITIKESGRDKVVTPTYQGKNVDRKFLIKFFGLENEDVEWYRIEEEESDGEYDDVI